MADQRQSKIGFRTENKESSYLIPNIINDIIKIKRPPSNLEYIIHTLKTKYPGLTYKNEGRDHVLSTISDDIRFVAKLTPYEETRSGRKIPRIDFLISMTFQIYS